MTYQVLARKWRPQDFASLVGQDHVVTALGNALAEERVAQAYLFSGIRGVGKTTAARVLAKALNCERGPAADPCNECTSCLEITSGHSLDVIEVDAATYSKVEQVRELTETLRYGPARGRYKVVVLDEVHRLSKQAFDALLKIVEEPPAHLVFIFATTEIDAVPATILSRCQEFQFRRVTQPVLAAHLRSISEAEDIEVSDAALRMIARAGEGSVRDSVALLDQMATFGSGAIGDDDAQRILGGLDTAIFQQLLAALLAGERTSIVALVREIEANGWDPHNVYAQFLVFLRDALHVALGGGEVDGSGELTREEAALLRQTVDGHGYESLLQILQLLITSEPTVRRSEFSLLALEIAWLRAAELPKITRLQELLGTGDAPDDGGSPGSGPKSTGSGSRTPGTAGSASATPAVARRDAATPKTVSGPVAPRCAAPDAASEAEGGATLETCDPAKLPDFLELLASRRQSLAAYFEGADLRFDRRTLLISPPGDDSLCLKALERKGNQKILLAALGDVWGDGVSWRIQGTAAPRPAAEPPNGSAPRAPAANAIRATRPASAPPRASSDSPIRTAAPSGPGPSLGRDPAPMPDDTFRPGPAHGAFQEPPDWARPDWHAGPAGDGGRSRVSAEEAAAVSEVPVVRFILSTFGGTIQSVEPVSEDGPR